MSTILLMLGWRLYFYSDEGSEPVHIHARKAEAECKFWLHPDAFDIEEAWSKALTPRLRREIREIVFDHFGLILSEWQRRHGGK
jgi:hypothetical protein